MYRNVVKPIFFSQDPEAVHDLLTITGRFLGTNFLTKFATRSLFNYDHHLLQQEVCGLSFRNPLGLSAGFDKNANLVKILPDVGFGHMEIGSITWDSYTGNPKPRLYRLPKSKGLVVFYGLKNEGVHKIAPRIKLGTKGNRARVGVSIAKTNSTNTSSLEGGIDDYVKTVEFLQEANIGEYYTINISCPNTFGGEPFTTPQRLSKLLAAITKLEVTKPVFVKMPINLSLNQFDSLLRVCVDYKINGVVIGNLTKVRDPQLIKDEIPSNVQGGISGKPTEELCNNLIAHTYDKYKHKLIIIGVGGIFSAEDAYKKIKNGATLLQLITGMIYNGPQLIGEINAGLVKLLQKDGYQNISEAVGSNFR